MNFFASRDNGPFGKFNNYHYRKGNSLQMFPLVSKAWPNGIVYRTVPPPPGQAVGDVMWTDAFGCHGTSGSGVFPSGTDYRLLGPVALGSSSMSGRLCVNGSTAQVGGAHLGYVRPMVTRLLEAFAVSDR